MDTLTSIADRRSVKHYDPTHEMSEAEIQQLMTEITSEGEAKIQLSGRELTIAKQFRDDLKSQSLEESLRHSRKAGPPVSFTDRFDCLD